VGGLETLALDESRDQAELAEDPHEAGGHEGDRDDPEVGGHQQARQDHDDGRLERHLGRHAASGPRDPVEGAPPQTRLDAMAHGDVFTRSPAASQPNTDASDCRIASYVAWKSGRLPPSGSGITGGRRSLRLPRRCTFGIAQG
jgi:hypothetical protein